MYPSNQEKSVPLFEIDQPEAHKQCILNNSREILGHLRTLQKKHSFVTLYLDTGREFFLSTILAVDEENRRILFDAPRLHEQIQHALSAQQITLSTIVDRIKIQCRLSPFELITIDDHPILSCKLPEQMLRLQRRDFFRIETPRHPPVRCKLAKFDTEAHSRTFDFPLHDISGGGMCLTGKIEYAEQFVLGELFADCRLEIPGESVTSVNLRVKEVSRIETSDGEPLLRLGCEFVNLPGTRLALIERYITRLERERKTKDGKSDQS